MIEWIQITGLFLGTGALSFILISLFVRSRYPEKQVNTDDDLDLDVNEKDLVLGQFTPAISNTLPSRDPKPKDLQSELRSAGFYRPTAVVEYRAVRNVLALISVLASGIIALLAPASQMFNVLIIGLLLVGMAFALPRFYLAMRARARSRAIERGLPLAIDLLILCLSAGQNLLTSLQQVARQLRKPNPVLAQELTIAHQQAELHSLQHALKQWADRVKINEVRNLVMLLIQSEKLGADAAATLGDLANNFRISARQRAEAQANRTSFWLLFPTVFCFWVASAIVLIGPAYLEYFQYQSHAPDLFNQAVESVEGANNPNPAPPPPPQPDNPAQ